MKKLFFIFLAVFLLTASSAYAQGQAVDPKNGPEVWVTSVFNNSSSTVNAGDIVIWDIDDSAGDNDNYINTTTTADTSQVAGIVWPAAIAGKAYGSIATRAMGITVNTGYNAPGAGSELCTSGVAGIAVTCSEIGDPNRVGFCTSARTNKTCVAYISVL